MRLRFAPENPKARDPLGRSFDVAMKRARSEADAYYETVLPSILSAEERRVMRQAFAGMIWSKQYYGYDVRRWLMGDPAQPPPPARRRRGRNREWTHLYAGDVLSMPDTWEFPWFAAWDLAFHCVVFALIDPQFAKDQLVLMLREWYMHPNGQIPAYEWAFGDVNPPVHAWAAIRVAQIEKHKTGRLDRVFLERVFHKLLLNFDWWVNRKDELGNNIFQGGFLGLDNIGLFDRNTELPPGWILGQADGTSWMAMYCLNLLGMSLELALEDPAYEDVASKFWEHFVYIAYAMHHVGEEGFNLWDEEDGFFYDVLRRPDGSHEPIRIRTLVGLIPLSAVVTGELSLLDRFPGFKRRMHWFTENRPDLIESCSSMTQRPDGARALFSLVTPEQLRRVLRFMLDENEFLSPHGIRSVSLYHRDHPYVDEDRGGRVPDELRPRRIDDGDVRGQLELARPDLVADQLPAPGVAPALPPVPGRRLPGRVPDRLREDDDAPRSVPRARPAALHDLLARRTGREAGVPGRSTSTGTIRTGGTSSSSTSTSTATPARASAPRTRRDGRD